MNHKERGEREDGARHNSAGRAADAGDDDVFEQARAARVEARQADGQNREGAGGPVGVGDDRGVAERKINEGVGGDGEEEEEKRGKQEINGDCSTTTGNISSTSLVMERLNRL